MQTTKAKGDAGESFAAKYLEEKGMKILQRNFRYDRGEIDIVAEDDGEIVFVEVKSRQTHAFGSPEEAIHLKRNRISNARRRATYSSLAWKTSRVALTLLPLIGKVGILKSAISRMRSD